MSENHKHGDLSVYELPGKELREMILEHANSLVECQKKVSAALEALPAEPDFPELGIVPMARDDEMPSTPVRGEQSRVVFEKTIKQCAFYEAEARWLADHIPLDKAFMLNATQITSFKTRWGVIDLDVEKLRWAPAAAASPNAQAERSLASTVSATPRILFPDGTLIGHLGT